MSAVTCGLAYRPIGSEPGEVGLLRCTFLEDHDGPCSWQDVADLDRATCPPDAAAAMDLASAILDGAYDPWLELILNAGHNRKRTLRGVPGFTGREVYEPTRRKGMRR